MLEFRMLGINGSLQEAASGNTSLLVSDGTARVLVDASVRIDEAVAGDVDAVFLTHEHIDHVYGLPSLVHQLWLSGREKPLPVICHPAMRARVEDLLGVFGLREKPHMFPITVVDAGSHGFGGMSFHTFKTDHTPASVGLVVEEQGRKLVYTADTRPISGATSLLADPDVLVHEASGLACDEEVLVRKGHSSGADAASLAVRLHARRLFLCHLPQGEARKKQVLEEAGAVFPAACIPVIDRTERV